MKGKIVLITGANSGFGLETALRLAELGAQLILVCRDPARGAAAQARIAGIATGPAPTLASSPEVGVTGNYFVKCKPAPSKPITHDRELAARLWNMSVALTGLKMSFDMAVDLRPHNVASVAVWPGYILSEMLESIPREHLSPELVARLPEFETPDFTGMVIERLWRDPERMVLSGEALIGAELGKRYGIKDLDGKQPRVYSDSMGKPSGRFVLSPASTG